MTPREKIETQHAGSPAEKQPFPMHPEVCRSPRVVRSALRLGQVRIDNLPKQVYYLPLHNLHADISD